MKINWSSGEEMNEYEDDTCIEVSESMKVYITSNMKYFQEE